MVGEIIRPTTIKELAESIREISTLRISGLDTNASIRTAPPTAVRLELSGMNGIVDYEPRDQVIVVRAGTPLNEIESHIDQHGFQIPGKGIGTLGGSISMGDAASSSVPVWRDSVLGMRVVLADGRIVKFGSRAVKNVAGYDGHKLFIGARGTLGVVAEVFLRLTPGAPRTASESGPRAVSLITDPTVIKYMRRAKELFDPTHKLNPGEMGIF